MVLTIADVRNTGLVTVLGFAAVTFALDLVLLLATYLVLASITPTALGEVADSPTTFAAWISLVRWPMALAYTGALSARGLKTLLTKGEVADVPSLKGWRHVLVTVRGWTADSIWWMTAALIVFDYIADPGDAYLWPLVVLTAAGPILLPVLLQGSLWPLRRRWQRRQSNRTPAAIAEEGLSAPERQADSLDHRPTSD